MAEDDFDWDAHMATAPYNTVLRGMRVARKLIPSMLSPDSKLVFLATYDEEFPTNNADVLTKRLREVHKQLQSLWEHIDTRVEEVYRHEVDYLLLWSLLSDLSAVPEDHDDPDEQLRRIYQTKNPGQQQSL